MKLNELQVQSKNTIDAVDDLLKRETPAWFVEEWRKAPIMRFTELAPMLPFDDKWEHKNYDDAVAFYASYKRNNVLAHIGDGSNPNPYRSTHIVSRDLAGRLKSLLAK